LQAASLQPVHKPAAVAVAAVTVVVAAVAGTWAALAEATWVVLAEATWAVSAEATWAVSAEVAAVALARVKWRGWATITPALEDAVSLAGAFTMAASIARTTC
jgi:hypothetical protein